MVGGYPAGRDWDLCREDGISEADWRAACKLIMGLPIPDRDPVTGGPMTKWREALSTVD